MFQRFDAAQQRISPESAKARYTTGRLMDLDAVRASARMKPSALAGSDAFITAYPNGKRIPVREGSASLP
ncbi:MAG: hypothetical protein IPF41_16920 [Flavobacteriales bacterium]|nr:hypothetical protein [Flavobacteriales bacterium]